MCETECYCAVNVATKDRERESTIHCLLVHSTTTVNRGSFRSNHYEPCSLPPSPDLPYGTVLPRGWAPVTGWYTPVVQAVRGAERDDGCERRLERHCDEGAKLT